MYTVNIRTYHHGNLREALIKAALKEVAKEGIEGFSLRNIARRAGVSAPAVYRHFEDKEALLAAVAKECADRLAATMLEAVAKAPPNDPLERFRATGIALVRFAVAHPEHFRALSVTPVDSPEHDAWHANERRALLDAQAKGHIVNLPLDDILLCANATMMGLARDIIDGKLGEVDETRAIELATRVTEVLGCGFAPRKP